MSTEEKKHDDPHMASPKPQTYAAPEAIVCGIPLRYVALACLVVQTTMAVILTRHSKIMRTSDQLPYHSTTLVIMAESTKFLLSLLLVFIMDCREHHNFADRFRKWKLIVHQECLSHPMETVKVSVPAVLYTIQNNLIYVALANLEATTFQVGYQMKVITTAILSVMMLSRKLSSKSWTALVGLTIGIIMTQIEGSKKGVDNTTEQNFALGLFSVVTCGFCSAFAGVYFEKILKGTNPSLWIRNTQLAFFSVICGLFTMVTTDGFLMPSKFFQGYDTMVWVIILVQAAGGLIVAVVVKYADNIMKGFAAALSIVLCGLLSVQLFGFHPTLFFISGSTIVIGATFLYSTPDRVPVNPKGSSPTVASPTLRV